MDRAERFYKIKELLRQRPLIKLGGLRGTTACLAAAGGGEGGGDDGAKCI